LALRNCLISSFIVFGEIGLSGEIRAVSQPNLRLKEAQKLGFTNAIIPNSFNKDKKQKLVSDMSYHEIGNVQRLISKFS
jgi:DNA repair protein RadA/Sms